MEDTPLESIDLDQWKQSVLHNANLVAQLLEKIKSKDKKINNRKLLVAHFLTKYFQRRIRHCVAPCAHR